MKNKAKEFKRDADYLKLVEDIRKLMDEAYVKGVDFNPDFSIEKSGFICETVSNRIARLSGPRIGKQLDVGFGTSMEKRRVWIGPVFSPVNFT